MTYKTIREIIDYVRAAHRKAARCCREATHASSDRTSMLADLFRDREAVQADALRKFEETGQQELLETWVQFVPSEEMGRALGALRTSTGEDPAAMLRRCLELQEQIVDLFRHLAEVAGSPEVRELFSKLAELELRAVEELGMSETSQYDV